MRAVSLGSAGGCVCVCECGQAGSAMAGKASFSVSGGSGVLPFPGELPEAAPLTPVEYKCSSRENKAHKAAEESGQSQRDACLVPVCSSLSSCCPWAWLCAGTQPNLCEGAAGHLTDRELLVARRNHKQQNHFKPCHSLEVFITFICTLPPFSFTRLKK